MKLKTKWKRVVPGGNPRRNNCVPVAIANALHIPYSSVLRRLDTHGIYYDYFYEPDFDGWNLKFENAYIRLHSTSKCFKIFKFKHHDKEFKNVDLAPDNCVVEFGSHVVAKVNGVVLDRRDPRFMDKRTKKQPLVVHGYWTHPAIGDLPPHSDC